MISLKGAFAGFSSDVGLNVVAALNVERSQPPSPTHISIDTDCMANIEWLVGLLGGVAHDESLLRHVGLWIAVEWMIEFKVNHRVRELLLHRHVRDSISMYENMGIGLHVGLIA